MENALTRESGMTFLSQRRDRLLFPAIEARARAYGEYQDNADWSSRQTDLLNESWSHTIRSVPRWKDLVRQGKLPGHFTSAEEFFAVVPVCDRGMAKSMGSALISNRKPPEVIRATGGTTAEPIQIPAWKTEAAWTQTDMWLARSWYGIQPADRLFLIWGHSHLLGQGTRRLVNAYKRILADRVLGYRRFSAYDLSQTAMRKCCLDLLKFRPAYLIGYSVALHKFQEANKDSKDDLQRLGLKAVIGTAENFPTDYTEQSLGEIFAAPVAMEYGSVETHVMAHTHPQGKYRVMWQSYLLEVQPMSADRHPNSGVVRVTSLYPRCLPLVRYALGDELLLDPEDKASPSPRSVVEFQAVRGRCNDYVALENGRLIHSEAFTHVLRSVPFILAYQIIQSGTQISIDYLSKTPLPGHAKKGIIDRLVQVDELLSRVTLERVARLRQTPAGKTPMVIRG